MPVHVWVGADERPEFVRQSELLANVWTGLGVDMRADDRAGAAPFQRDRRADRPGLGPGRGASSGRRREAARPGGGDRRRRRRLLGALSPGEGGLDRRDADRALGADQRVELACGGRVSHAERRPERREAPGLHGVALPRAGGDLRAVVQPAPDRRGDDGGRSGADGLPAPRPRQGAVPGHGHRDHHAGRGGGDVPADGSVAFRRRALGPGGGASRSGRDDARLRQGGAEARGDDRAPQPGGGADPGAGRARGTSSPSTGRSRRSMW